MGSKWERREKKRQKKKNQMGVSGRSLKSTILPIIGKKAEEAEKHGH